MINTAELNQAMIDSGLKKSAVAARLNMTTQTLTRKINGEAEFTISEADDLSDILGFSLNQRRQIFLPAK